ncbi:MAG: serine--tRNA ligase [Oscillospiraceae bacterium]|nr:serine--tRNA ligase [Oscillospiraceae bacterium]
MLDIKFVRENPEIVKENIKKKFKDAKLPLVDEVIALDEQKRAAISEASDLRANRNKISREIGVLMGKGEKEKAMEMRALVNEQAERLSELEGLESELEARVRDIMMKIPNIIDPSVPIGKDDKENVEVEQFGEKTVPTFEIPYHTDIMAHFAGIDKEAAGRVAGEGFYYLMGDIARLHSAVLSYARDFMIDKGFVYCIPPFMIRSNVVTGVMSFEEMDAMMYKIEGEDLYLIGTSEHSMIGKFIDTTTPESSLPLTLTSYSPCFRKEKGAHGIEERGIYRIHQFEKQEMIVICKPEESMEWFNKMHGYSVELFRSLDIPVRTLECCSGDLADLKVKSYDVEAWSPKQQKYFEVCSCSNLGDAQARRLGIKVKGEDGKKYLAHTLNNTVVAPPRMLIAFLENNLEFDGEKYSIRIPEALRPYMGGKSIIKEK